MHRLIYILFGAFLTAAVGVPALADTPREVRDIVGDQAKAGRKELERRGYHKTGVTKTGEGAYLNFWNPGSRTCLSVHRVGDRYDSIVSAPSFDCDQNDTYDRGDDDDKGAAVAIGAAAVIGAIALAHNSRHHDDGNHHSSVDEEAEFERGYRDGLYNQPYHNYSNSKQYSNGYESGVDQRAHETSYRRSHSSHSGGYRESVNMNYMVGEGARNLGNEMERKGFANVDVIKSGNAIYDVYWNARTRQCLQATVADGRVVDMVDIHTHPNCR